jgi:hypothetical protein
MEVPLLTLEEIVYWPTLVKITKGNAIEIRGEDAESVFGKKCYLDSFGT